MKTTNLFPALLLASAAALLPLGLKASDDSGGAGGNATRGGDGGAGGDGMALRPPEISDEKLAAFEKSLTPEQRALIEAFTREFCKALWKQQEARFKQNVPAGQKEPTLDDFVKEQRRAILAWIAPLPQEQLQKYFKELPEQIKKMRAQNDPAYVDESERTAAEALPAEARAEADALLSADLDAYLAARRKLLARGAACVPLVSEKLASLKEGDERGLRLRSLLAELRQDPERQKEKIIRAAEAAARRVEALKAAQPADAKSRYAWLLSRRLVGGVRLPEYEQACYYSFPKVCNGYGGAVSLEFDNSTEPDGLNVLMYGGQQNRIKDLGAADFAAAASGPAPAPKDRAGWSRRDVPGVLGHVYLEHCFEPGDGIDKIVAFKVVALVSGEYVVLEWQPIPAKQ
ncbi:MAG: hypothetical protein KIS92_12190 [Planctomycetota bacterium]|nr:hypothetical protein [Planctomycetota bacterium]